MNKGADIAGFSLGLPRIWRDKGLDQSVMPFDISQVSEAGRWSTFESESAAVMPDAIFDVYWKAKQFQISWSIQWDGRSVSDSRLIDRGATIRVTDGSETEEQAGIGIAGILLGSTQARETTYRYEETINDDGQSFTMSLLFGQSPQYIDSGENRWSVNIAGGARMTNGEDFETPFTLSFGGVTPHAGFQIYESGIMHVDNPSGQGYSGGMSISVSSEWSSSDWTFS